MFRSGDETMTRLILKGSVSFNPSDCNGLHTGRGFGDLLFFQWVCATASAPSIAS